METVRELILDCIEALLLLGIFEALYDRKGFIQNNKFKTALFCILYIFSNYLGTFYVSKVYHTLIVSIFSVLILTLVTKSRILFSSIIFFLFIIVVSITESIVEIIEILIFNINLNEIFFNSKYLYIFLVSTKLLQILIVFLIIKKNKYFAKFRLFQDDSILFSNLIIQIGIFSIFIFSINFGIFHIKNTRIYNIIIFSIYFLFLIFELKELKEYHRIVNTEAKYKIQESQIKNMTEIIRIIRQEKHDFANHINVIWGLCLLNKEDTVEKIKNYVSGISDSVHSSFKFIETGNDYLNGLISIKNNYAANNNIAFDIFIEEPFSSLKINENELISIVSNLIDNAFESFQIKSDIKNKEISMCTFIEDNKFYIEIGDNGDMIPKNIQDKIFQRGFSTKISQSSDHGFGLYITKQLVEKNNGRIFLESNPESTTFSVEFKMEELDNE
jgi:two-component system, LytTR family, sensor histidine kinase AgrC